MERTGYKALMLIPSGSPRFGRIADRTIDNPYDDLIANPYRFVCPVDITAAGRFAEVSGPRSQPRCQVCIGVPGHIQASDVQITMTVIAVTPVIDSHTQNSLVNACCANALTIE